MGNLRGVFLLKETNGSSGKVEGFPFLKKTNGSTGKLATPPFKGTDGSNETAEDAPFQASASVAGK